MEHRNINELLETYWEKLYFYAYKLLNNKSDAEDAVAVATMKVFQRGLDGIENIQGYLYTTVRNVCLNTLSQRQRLSLVDSLHALHDELPDAQGSIPEQSLIRGEFFQSLWKEVERLPDEYRALFKLRCLEEKSFVEIAELLELTPKTVSDRYKKALFLLKMHVLKKGLLPCIVLIMLVLTLIRKIF